MNSAGNWVEGVIAALPNAGASGPAWTYRAMSVTIGWTTCWLGITLTRAELKSSSRIAGRHRRLACARGVPPETGQSTLEPPRAEYRWTCGATRAAWTSKLLCPHGLLTNPSACLCHGHSANSARTNHERFGIREEVTGHSTPHPEIRGQGALATARQSRRNFRHWQRARSRGILGSLGRAGIIAVATATA